MPKQTGDPISDPLRAAVRDSRMSLSALAKEAGITASILSRFMAHETRLRIDHADQLARCLGLELRMVKRRRT